MSNSNTKYKLALVDADVLRYRCGFAVEYSLFHVEGLSESFRGKKAVREYMENLPISFSERYPEVTEEKVIEPPENAIQIVKNYLAQIERVLGCPSQLILSGKTNFRDDIATIKPYKGNRPDRKPACFDALTAWMLDNGAVVTDGIEADDLLAIRSDNNTVICSVDKDLLQVPGWHYDFVKDELQYVDDKQAWFNLCVQIIAGDSTDNIQGIPGIGLKKAEKLLEGCETQEEMDRAVVDAYQSAFGDHWEHFYMENAQLVYLLRFPEDHWDMPVLPEDYLEEDSFGSL